jgi:hypothetical protein
MLLASSSKESISLDAKARLIIKRKDKAKTNFIKISIRYVFCSVVLIVIYKARKNPRD